MPRCVNELCSLLGYSRQSYYKGIRAIQYHAYQEDIVIAEVIKYRKHQKRIGTRKLLAEMRPFLKSHNIKMGRDRLFELLAERGLLVSRFKRSGPKTTLSRHRYRKYPNLIREFVPTAPNQLWVSDITYICLRERFAYLSLVTDAYSRKIVGFFLSKDLGADGTIRALKMALGSVRNVEGLIHHSDRGVQYCCDDYVEILNKRMVKISMTENGDPLENAIAERINGILKHELLADKFDTFNVAREAVAIACTTYNYLRPHSSINYLKPVDAHKLSGPIPRTWKNYYTRKEACRV